MLCLGLKKSLLSPKLELMAQGMAQHTNDIPLSYSGTPARSAFKNYGRQKIIILFLGKGGGHSFRSSVETQKIRAGPGNSLDIASAVGQVTLQLFNSVIVSVISCKTL